MKKSVKVNVNRFSITYITRKHARWTLQKDGKPIGYYDTYYQAQKMAHNYFIYQ